MNRRIAYKNKELIKEIRELKKEVKELKEKCYLIESNINMNFFLMRKEKELENSKNYYTNSFWW